MAEEEPSSSACCCTPLTSPVLIQIKTESILNTLGNFSDKKERKVLKAPRKLKRKPDASISIYKIYSQESFTIPVLSSRDKESLQVLAACVVLHELNNRMFREQFKISKILNSETKGFLMTQNGTVRLMLKVPETYFCQAEMKGCQSNPVAMCRHKYFAASLHKSINRQHGERLKVDVQQSSDKQDAKQEKGKQKQSPDKQDAQQGDAKQGNAEEEENPEQKACSKQQDICTEREDFELLDLITPDNSDDVHENERLRMTPITIILPEDYEAERFDSRERFGFIPLDDDDESMGDAASMFGEDRDLGDVMEGEELSTELSDMNVDCDYVPAREIINSISQRTERIKKQRRFVRLAMNLKAGMMFSRLLNLSISYEPNTIIEPSTPEIIIGVTENESDFPQLQAGQRRISPVLVTMPSGVTFSQPLMIRCALLSRRTPRSSIRVLCSHTEVTEPTRWRDAHQVDCYTCDDLMKITLLIRHFCLYTVIEEAEPVSVRHKVLSIYLRRKKFRGTYCVEMNVGLTDSVARDVPPALGGKLVRQENFPLLNAQPVSIRVSAKTAEWNTFEPLEQELDEHAMSCTELPARHRFTISCLDETSPQANTLAFEVTVKQAGGRAIPYIIEEDFEDLFGESICQQQPVQPMQPQHVPSAMMQAGASMCSQPSQSQSIGEERHASRSGAASDCSHIGQSASRETAAATTQGATATVRPDAPNLPTPASSSVTAPSSLAACPGPNDPTQLQRFIPGFPATSHSLPNHHNYLVNVTNNYYQETSSQLPIASAKEWKVSHEACAKVAEYLDHHNDWKMLASKLKFDKAIDLVSQRAANQGKSPTEMLLREWMLQSEDASAQRLKQALLDMPPMGRQDIVDELEDILSVKK